LVLIEHGPENTPLCHSAAHVLCLRWWEVSPPTAIKRESLSCASSQPSTNSPCAAIAESELRAYAQTKLSWMITKPSRGGRNDALNRGRPSNERVYERARCAVCCKDPPPPPPPSSPNVNTDMARKPRTNQNYSKLSDRHRSSFYQLDTEHTHTHRVGVECVECRLHLFFIFIRLCIFIHLKQN